MEYQDNQGFSSLREKCSRDHLGGFNDSSDDHT